MCYEAPQMQDVNMGLQGGNEAPVCLMVNYEPTSVIKVNVEKMHENTISLANSNSNQRR